MASSSDPKLANRILRGLVIGLIAGVITLGVGQIWPDALTFMQQVSTQLFDPIGQVFLRLLFFVIVPIVFASLASGVLQLGQPERLGPLAGRTFFLFFLNMASGVGLALLVMNVVQPGRFIDEDTTKVLMASYGSAAEKAVANQKQAQEGLSLMMLVEMFMPRNLFGAFVGNNRATIGEMLPLILFAILLGAGGASLAVDRRAKLLEALNTVSELMTSIVHFALRLAPYAVPAMIYSVIVRVGLDVVVALGVFVLACAGVLALHLFGMMTLWIKFWTKRKPTEYFAAIKGVLITAFSTSSSAATLPASIECAREKLQLSPSTSGFVLPLGATMNMSGTAIYKACVVLFIAQIFHVDLGLGQQLMLLLLAVLSAVAAPAIPGSALPLVAGLLATFGLEPAGIGIILGIDRILDMCRTTVNVGFDLTTATIVDEYVKRTEAKATHSP